jgi:MarR family transcriptional regulator for hemolysin
MAGTAQKKPTPEFAALPRSRQRVAQLIGEVAREWRFLMNEALKPLGLTLATRQVLVQLHRNPPALVQSDLARRLGIESPTLVPLLNRLEKKGWIQRETDESDSRKKKVSLTSRGQAQIPSLEAVSVQLRQRMMRDMPLEEVEMAAHLLQKIRDNISRD